MSFFFLCIIVLSITEVSSLCILSVFCYKQDKIKMFFESKTSVLNDVKVDVDKLKKENSK
jgi:uncharacterized membrane protein YcaP (DUF421 family)